MTLRNWPLVFLLAYSPTSQGKLFETSYLQIGIPDSWSCEKIGADWACRPTDNKTVHTASLIFTAKGAAPEDTLSALDNQLRAPRTISGASGRSTVTSQLRWTQKVTLNGYDWIEALHANREIEGFNTYYLATVTPQLTILLNFTFQQNLAKDFEPVLQELRKSIGLKAETLEAAPKETFAQPVAPVASPGADANVSGPGSSAPKPLELLWIVGLGAIALVIIFAMRRKSR